MVLLRYGLHILKAQLKKYQQLLFNIVNERDQSDKDYLESQKAILGFLLGQ